MKKRVISICLAALMAVGLLAGCGGSASSDNALQKTSAGSSAKGKYIKTEACKIKDIPATYVNAIKTQNDGSILSLETVEDSHMVMAVSTDKGATWKNRWTADGEIKDINIDHTSINRQGVSFVSGYDMTQPDSDERTEASYYLVDADGKATKIPVQLPNGDDGQPILISFLYITDENELFAADYQGTVLRIDAATGEVKQTYTSEGDTEDFLVGMTVTKEDVVLNMSKSVRMYDKETGEIKPQESALEETFSGSSNFIVAAGTTYDDNTIFIVSNTGLWVYTIGGSKAEKMTGINTQTIYPSVIDADKDGSFYMILEDQSDILYRYDYDSEADASIDHKIKVYSLEYDWNINQLTAQYQESHPQTEITYEVGMTGDDAMTQSDAIKALNTKLLAGEGPDIILLNGLDMDSYIDKGFLIDLSDTIGDQTPYVKGIFDCASRDGAVYGVPSSYGVEMAIGREDVLTDDSLSSAIANIKNLPADVKMYSVKFDDGTASTDTVSLLNAYYDVMAQTWTNKDGTLKEDGVRAFFEACKELSDRTDLNVSFGGSLSEGPVENMTYCDVYSILRNEPMSIGPVRMLSDYLDVSTAGAQADGYTSQLVKRDGKTLYYAYTIMSVNSRSQDQEAAKDFISFTLGEEGQKAVETTNSGFPIRLQNVENLFDKAVADAKEYGSGSVSLWNENGQTYEYKYPELTDEFKQQTIQDLTTDLGVCINQNMTMRTTMYKYADQYMAGSIDIDAAVKGVMDEMNINLAE